MNSEAAVPDHPAPAHVEDLHRRLERVLGDADHVEVLRPLGHQVLGLRRLAGHGDPVAQAGGPLEFEVVGRFLHGEFQPLEDRLGVPGEEAHEVFDIAVVRDVVDGPDAWPRTALNVIEEARPTQALMADELVVGAGADREAAHQEVEGGPDRPGVAVGAEVPDPLSFTSAHHGGAGPLVVQGHGQPGVALVVLEADVVAGQVGLDQRVLEDQRIHLVLDHHPLDVVGLGHHLGRAGQQVGRVLPVVGQPVAQGLGLAHVEDTALGVVELVGAGGVGDRACGGPVLHHPHSRARRSIGRSLAAGHGGRGPMP
jgi:hypothetical protein